MHRLLNASLPALRKLPSVSFSFNIENVNFRTAEGAALLNPRVVDRCKECARFQSTKANPNVKQKKVRKRAKTQRKYYEVLVVTDSTATQKKSSVSKLSWSDLKLLANTNLNLSELYKLKDLSKSNKYVEEHTYNNLAVIENIPDGDVALPEAEADSKVITCDIPSEAAALPPQPVVVEPAATEYVKAEPAATEYAEAEPDLLDILPNIKPFQPEVVEHPEEEEAPATPVTNVKTPTDRKARLEVANKTLAAYAEVCSILKMPQRGLNALIFHNTRALRGKDRNFASIKDIKVYNALLRGYASKSDLYKLEEILAMMRKENLVPDVHSYVAIFECLGRANVKDCYLKQIRTYGKEALRNGFTFDRIMNEGIFADDDRKMVLQVMKKFDPSYVPTYHPPVVQYDNHLVNHLNDERQMRPPEATKCAGTGGLFTPKSLKKAINRQLELEKQGYIVVKSIEARNGVTDEVLKYREALANHFKVWEEMAATAFNRDLAALTAQRSPLNYEPYMRSLPVKDFITIIVDEAKKIAEGSETYSPTVNHLYRDMGNKVYARYKVLRKQKNGVLDKVLSVHGRYCEDYAANHGKLDALPSKVDVFNPRQRWQWAERELRDVGATLAMDHREWSPSTLQTIGKFLYQIVMHDLKVDVNAMRTNSKHKNYLPAFYTIFRTQGRIIKEEVKPHPVLSRLYRASMPETLSFPSYELPMRCPPVPWTSIDNGGYLISPCDVIRLPPQATSQKQRLNEAKPAQLYPSLDALNQLGAVPWKVNTRILDVILEVFNKGGSSKLDVPEPPSSLTPPPSSQIAPDMDKNEKFKLFKQRLQYRRKKAEMYSLWCDCLYRLSLANHFRDDIFWLPHNMDFRGRVYPVPPHLNHLGSDLARSMLVFAEARPLGPDGLSWLKLHLINLTGLKKRDSIDERLRYADDIMEDILDSADDPLGGKMWWAQSEEPWQTLACCMEVAAAMRSPDPAAFRSHFPIHQDGSCNGLQHYAALGRDSAGAYSVNLCPSSVPQDVYSAVVSLVEEQRRKDAANGLEVAKLLDGFVKRKVIKQTVMTTVYGVTRFGARLQIARQLKDIDEFPKEAVWPASSYLTGRTFESLRTMFTSTREIQDWFTDCARLISGVSGRYVEWVTPMGLPIVQPYFKYKTLGTSQVYKPFHMDHFEKPNVMKQKNAFPPNYIHSLDSSHMMLTSLHCERAGITFVSVHDCYWTHPSTVHIMNKICREQFVKLHSEPLLENLSLFLAEKYSYSHEELTDDGSVTDLTKKKLNRVLRQLPKTGDFDISRVLDSVYFFS